MNPHVASPTFSQPTPLIVGVGASAGGLSALEDFLANTPADSGLAYVVVQHRALDQDDLLVPLLQRVSALPVKAAQDAVPVQPNTVYVMPAGGELTVQRGCLHFRPAVQHPGLRWPINAFLTSLAQDQGPKAIGIVLSGMGSDGVLGLQAIRARGGVTLVQQPDTAEFSSMPQSALDAACVDASAPAEQLPALLHQRLHNPQATQGGDAAQGLSAVLALLRTYSKHDLSLYKTSTLRRRIERRMGVHQLDSLSAYVDFLQANPQELGLLFSEMLIGVTTFFRDAQVWADLKEQVLPQMLSHPLHEGPWRAWVVGCSTGEEAYSLAMLFQEWMDESPQASQNLGLTFQVFATDLNAEAIAVARKGWYSVHALADVSAQRRERFFIPHEGGYQVRPALRDRVLFARHDVIIDPPFTRLDLLSCRNVLIYFNAALQRRLIPLFHYSLRQGGVMVLGGSETVGRSQNLFTTLSPKSRIYRRNEQPQLPGSVDFPIHRLAKSSSSVQEIAVPQTPLNNLQALADQMLLQNFAPPAVLVNETGDILYISGRIGRYLEPAAGKANWNIHVMAHPGIRAQLAAALRQAFTDQKAVDLTGLYLEGDAPRSLGVTVQPMKEAPNMVRMAMVVFRETETISVLAGESGHEAGDAALARQLVAAREEIQALRSEMQASRAELCAANESMQSANEELQSTNEELQSSNEELTTSKEEAQSMNEELQTINSELQSKLDDLSLAQSDMQNLLNSTDIATLFLDNDFNVRRYTEQATSIFHLRESDVGRPLSDLASTLNYPQLQNDVKETLRTLSACTRSVEASDGRWFSVRIMPYRTLANMIQGAVLTFVDVTVAKELEMRLRDMKDKP